MNCGRFKIFFIQKYNMYLQIIFAEPMMIEAEEPTRSRRTSFMSEGDMNDRGGDAIDGAFKRAMKKVYSVSNFHF